MNWMDFPHNIRNGRLRRAAYAIVGILWALMSAWLVYAIIQSF